MSNTYRVKCDLMRPENGADVIDEAGEVLITLDTMQEAARVRNLLNSQLAAANARVAVLEAERASIEYAAHMPADYPHGLPTWINMELYASYIGAKVSPHIVELIESGRLVFPNAPAKGE
jgi:hypothetical protein